MSQRCTNTELGKLLHAYELGLLDEKEKDLFETHLLSCDFCFEELKKFMPQAALLRSSPEVGKELSEGLSEGDDSLSLGGKLKKYLLPEVPMIFKPAFLYLVILLVIGSSFVMFHQSKNGSSAIRPFQMIVFMTTRSVSTPVFSTDRKIDGAIFFRCPQVIAGKEYRLEILSDDTQDVVFLNEHFRDFDDNQTARLIYPYPLMEKGEYTLFVKDDKQKELCRYGFRIE